MKKNEKDLVSREELNQIKREFLEGLNKQELIVDEFKKSLLEQHKRLVEQTEIMEEQEEMITFQQKRIDQMEDQISLILDMLEDLSMSNT